MLRAFQIARRLVQEAGLCMRPDAPDIKCWISVKKTRGRLRPSRIAHRAAEMISELRQEHYSSNLLKITMEMRGNFVFIGNLGKLGGPILGQGRWFPLAHTRYPKPAQLDLATDWINYE